MSMIKAGLKQGVFIFAVIAIVLPLAISGGIFLSYYKHETVSEINDDNMHIAGIIRDGVSYSLKAPRRTLNVVARLAAHPEYAPHIDDLMAQMVNSYGFFESIMVLDGNGILRHLGTASNIKQNRQDYLGIDLSEAVHIAEAQRSRQPTWSDTYISPFSGEPTLSLTIPFKSGLVVGNFNFAELTTAIERHLSQSHDRIYLVNSKGRIIAHPQKALVLQQVNVSDLSVVRAGLEGREGIYEYNVEGVEFIGAVVTIPETGWLVIVERDKGEVFRVLRNMQWVFAVVLIGALLLVAGFVVYVNTRIVKPVVGISTATEVIAGGSFQPAPEYRGRFTELEDLSRNFNTMTTALREREQDLADANRDLEEEIERRIQSEEEVRQSEAKLRLILENSPHAIYVLSSEGKGLYVNAPAVTLTGYDRDDLLGRYFLDFVHPEDRDTLLKRREARLAGNKVENRYMFRILDRTGVVHWVENQVAMLIWEGGPATINFLQDVTASKRAEEELAKSEERFRVAFSTNPDAILISRIDNGVLIDVNHGFTEITGYTKEDVVNKISARELGIWDIPDDRQRFMEELQTKRAIDNLETRFRTKNGRVIFGSLSARVIMLNDVPHALWIGKDITARRQAEEALRREKQFFESLFHTLPGPAYVFGVDGRFLRWNRYFETVMGYSPEDMAKMNALETIVPSDRENVAREIEKVFREGYGAIELHSQTADGKVIPHYCLGALMEIEDTHYLIGVGVDMTERNRAAEALRKSEERYRELFESAGDAIFLMEGDRFMDCNPRTLEMFGCTRDQIVGAQPYRFSPPSQPDGRDSTEKALEMINSALDGMPQRFEWKHMKYDGSPFDAEVTLNRLDSGSGQSLQAIVRDMSDRKRAEVERERLIADIQKALADVNRSKKEWQDTFDSITDMISIHDKDYNVIKANKAFSANLGLSPQEVINRKCYDLLHHGASSPVSGCPHVQTMKKKVQVSEEVLDDITNKTYYVSTYPYFSPDGEFIGSIHISRDITEDKEREMRMIMTERLASLGQMASGIAHEINNPLESVMICAEMLLMRVAKDTYDQAQFEKYLKIIDEEVLRCRDITGNMLSFSRQTTTSRSDIDVHFLLDRAIDLVGYQGRLKNVSITKKYGEKLLVSGNEGELRQVFLVLLINALDAMENKGAITVETGMEQGGAWIKISDTGPGIAPENLQRIFNPFFSTKTEKGGTGLGLSIAHRIMANHQGSLTVVSEQSHGATFTVTLPR